MISANWVIEAPAVPSADRIFFSVLIMLLSFIPVFMLGGREGKLFHPLAFTKSFAMIGVAIISVTLVPALIPTFIKGRLRSEEENWIVRSFINIYRPLLTWALPRRNLVMWMFATMLLILAAGMFPSKLSWARAAFGNRLAEHVSSGVCHRHVHDGEKSSPRASRGHWLLFLAMAWGLVAIIAGLVVAGIRMGDISIGIPLLGSVAILKWLFYFAATVVTVVLFIIAFRVDSVAVWRTTTLASLLWIGMWAYSFSKIGVAFMPALDEGTTLDMPITVPRASVTQSGDDLKAPRCGNSCGDFPRWNP